MTAAITKYTHNRKDKMMAWEFSNTKHKCPACEKGILRHTGYRMVADNLSKEGLKFRNWRWNEIWDCDGQRHCFEIKDRSAKDITYTDREFAQFIDEGRYVGNKQRENGESDESYFDH